MRTSLYYRLASGSFVSLQKWQTLSPFGNSLSLCDVFKDSKDVQDFMESGLLLLNERYAETLSLVFIFKAA